MFCREHVAQLRGITEDVRARGAEIVVVGNGSPAQAAAFRDEFEIPFPLLTDPDLRSFRAAGLRRDLRATFNATTAAAGLRAMRGGHRQGRVLGDPWQQGGTFVITPAHEIAFAHTATAGGDHAPTADVLRALDNLDTPSA